GTREQRADYVGGQVVGAHRGQGAAGASDRRSQAIDQECISIHRPRRYHYCRHRADMRSPHLTRSPGKLHSPAMAHTGITVTEEVVAQTIEAFTTLDASGDRRAMTKMARRLGKEQPALLRMVADTKAEHGDAVGDAAVFYTTLIWAI